MPTSRRKPTKKTPCKHRTRVTDSKGKCRVRKSCAGKPRSLYKVKNTRVNCKKSRRYKKKSKPFGKSKRSKKNGKSCKKRKTDSNTTLTAGQAQAAQDVFDAAKIASKDAKDAEENALMAAVGSKEAAELADAAADAAIAIEDSDSVIAAFKSVLGVVYKVAKDSNQEEYNLKIPVTRGTAVATLAHSSDNINMQSKSAKDAVIGLLNSGLDRAISDPLRKWTIAQESFKEKNPMEENVSRRFETILKSFSAEHIVSIAESAERK